MAVAAGQNAAGTAAVAGSSAAAASSAAATGVLGSAMATVAASSGAAQTGMAVGAMATVTAAVTGGVAITEMYQATNGTATAYMMMNMTNDTTLPIMWNDTNSSMDIAEPPAAAQVCDMSFAEYKEGRVKFVMEGIRTNAFVGNHTSELEDMFIDVYNEVSNLCDGKYQRIGQDASLFDWSLIDAIDTGFLTSTFKVVVSCSGCADFEPLFFDGEPCFGDDQEECRRERYLEQTAEATLKDFSAKFEEKVNQRYAGVEDIQEVIIK